MSDWSGEMLETVQIHCVLCEFFKCQTAVSSLWSISRFHSYWWMKVVSIFIEWGGFSLASYKTSFMCCNSFPTFSRNQNTYDLDLGSRQVFRYYSTTHTLVWPHHSVILMEWIVKLTLYSVSNSDHFGDVSCFEPYGGGVRFDLTVTSKTHRRLEISVPFIKWFGCQNERNEENYHH